MIGRKRRNVVNLIGIRNQKQSQKIGLLKYKKILIGGLICVVLYMLFGRILGGTFSIRNIDLVFDSYSCGNEADIEREIGLKNRLIFWVSEGELNKRMKASFPCIREIELNKYFPDKVAVLVRGRVPVAAIVKGEGLGGLIDLAQVEATAASSAATVDYSVPSASSDKFFMDQEGVLFYSTSNDVNLPMVYVADDLSLRMSLGGGIGMSVKQVMEEIGKIDFYPRLIKLNNSASMVLVSDKGVKVVLNLKSDLLKQLASLQLIWQKNKIDSKRIESIDLRFTKPVVIYSK